MIELLRGYEWIYARLSADVTLTGLVGSRIYSELAPQEAPCPLITFHHQGGVDLRGVGTVRVFSNSLYLVKAITQGRSLLVAKPIADRVDALLHGATGSTSDGQILACVREQPLTYAETDGGMEYRHTGGIYRLIVQEL